jgi:heat shock protein HslJ
MSSTADPPSLDDTAWVLAELPGRALLSDHGITLRFEDGRAAGSDGCNRYG